MVDPVFHPSKIDKRVSGTPGDLAITNTLSPNSDIAAFF